MDKRIINATVLAILFSPLFAVASEEELASQESKSLTAENRHEWVKKKRLALAVQGRSLGPFGQRQHITGKKVQRSHRKAVKANHFPKAIAAIKINMVSESGRSFYIGFRQFKQGETFPLEYRQEKFAIKVALVGKGQVTFKNMETGEKVIKKLNSLPVGMARDSGIEAVPGVTPASKRNSGAIKVGE